MTESMKVVVTDHALWRAAERWKRSVGAEEIVKDVREAVAARRISSRRPEWSPDLPANESASYVWTEDKNCMYVVKSDRESLIVVTVYEKAA